MIGCYQQFHWPHHAAAECTFSRNVTNSLISIKKYLLSGSHWTELAWQYKNKKYGKKSREIGNQTDFKQVSLNSTTLKCKHPQQKCMWYRNDLYLWPWKPFQQCPLTWRIFVARFVEIRPLSMEISCHANKFLWPLPLTLKIFSAMATQMLITCAKLHWNPSTQWRDTWSHHMDKC